VFPVEYKHGARVARQNDNLQIGAQAICLEEMLDTRIAEGAIFHVASKRRRGVCVDTTLRAAVEDCVAAIRAATGRGVLPSHTPHRERCRACSLRDICAPELTATTDLLAGERAGLFAAD
jgi:CRISPR-associated exonuclease Cas4